MIVTRVIVLTISKSTYKERQITHDNTHVEPNFFFFKEAIELVYKTERD